MSALRRLASLRVFKRLRELERATTTALASDAVGAEATQTAFRAFADRLGALESALVCCLRCGTICKRGHPSLTLMVSPFDGNKAIACLWCKDALKSVGWKKFNPPQEEATA